MTKTTGTVWKIEPHTEAKHAILRKYLDAWLPIITRWNGRVVYIDGFAGPGEYIGGNDGSPIIAIKAVLEHRAKIKAEIQMLFIEADKKRCEFLKYKIEGIKLPSNIKTECICAKFDKTLTEIFNCLDQEKERLAPAFVFIDPFGFTGIPFSMIRKIMHNPGCEVLITFMYEEINRFITDNRLWDSLTETYGTHRWREVIPESDSHRREALLHNIYKRQLEQEANIKFVHSFKMTNKINKTDYFLFFGTNNMSGLRKMKEAMWKVDKSGAFQFSDATYNPSQPMLFDLEPDFIQLKKNILGKFKNKFVSIQELEYFILTQTPFRETHYKRQILIPMEKAGEIEANCPNRQRKKWTFPPECIIKFR